LVDAHISAVACRLLHNVAVLQDIVRDIADAVQSRSAEDRNFGTVLVPEGLIKAIPEMGTLLSEVCINIHIPHIVIQTAANC
jgi:diphosphate-dependent phosphofructokinase